MKKIYLFLLTGLLISSTGFAQSAKLPWREMTAFKTILSGAVKAASLGNLGVIKSNAAGLYKASKLLSESKLPAGLNEKETRTNLVDLRGKCNDVLSAVNRKEADASILTKLNLANDVFKKIGG